MKPGSKTFYFWTKLLVWVTCLAPLGFLLAGAFGWAGVSLGANPVEKILDECGQWGVRILLVTLAVSPVRRLTGANWLIGFRRLLGLFAFFYVALHLTTYLWLDQGWDLSNVVEDVVKRPFITLGMVAFVLLLALALTSTRAAMRRLGRNWQRLHRLVYLIAILAVWHYYWQVKLDVVQPAIYATILAVLLATRLPAWWRRRRRRQGSVQTQGGAQQA